MSPDDQNDQDDQDNRDDRDDKPEGNAKDELFEAFSHFRKAANIFIDKATHDPTVKSATVEAERVIQKVGDAAEPIARQVADEFQKVGGAAEPIARQFADELHKMTSLLANAVQDATGRSRKSSAPPAAGADADDGELVDDQDDQDADKKKTEETEDE